MSNRPVSATDSSAPASAPDGNVAEIQGVYGAFSFPEKLLQQIWARQEFLAAGLCTADGRTLRVRQAGRWNRLGGPDFLGAQIELGGQLIEGDVEVHLRAGDWAAHGHARDAAYDRVMLHVVLFPGAERFTRGASGREIPVLSLLAHLAHDLEEYAAEAAVERLASRAADVFFEEFSQKPLTEVRAELTHFAERRWQTKITAAAQRVAKLGWDEACHHTALEILGYRNNRAGMLQVAQAFSLARWKAAAEGLASRHDSANRTDRANEAVSAQPWIDAALAVGEPHWNRQGVRPANLPATRLRQYLAWSAARPDWPARLREAGGFFPAVIDAPRLTTAKFRQRQKLPALSRTLCAEITGDAIGGGRWDTLVCDGLLPLLAACAENDASARLALGAFWFHCPMGDLPDRVVAALRRLEVIGGRDWPASHGAGQGALAWLWAKDSGRAV